MAPQSSAPAAPAAAPAATAAPAPKKRGRKPWILISAAAVVVLACGGTGVWLLLGHGGTHQSVPAAPAPVGPPLYLALDPPFVANFEGEQQVRFLQVTVQLMTHDQKIIDLMKANDPLLRNDLLLLFGNQSAADLQSREGKEKLRAAALQVVRKVVAKSGGQGDKVEAVLFTSFVMQ